jgi:hypothetical protein
MSLSAEVTVTLPRDQFNEVCNLLQLIVVLDIKLYMQGGPQPKKYLLSPAFDALIKAGMPKPPPTPVEEK